MPLEHFWRHQGNQIEDPFADTPAVVGDESISTSDHGRGKVGLVGAVANVGPHEGNSVRPLGLMKDDVEWHVKEETVRATRFVFSKEPSEDTQDLRE